MKTICCVAQTREIEPSLASIRALQHEDILRVDFLTDAPNPDLTAWQNLLPKNQEARQRCLSDGFDYLLLIEDDIIVPPDALLKLMAADADVAYGLTCWRREPHCWSAGLITGPSDAEHITADMRPDIMRGIWGRVVDIQGCGLFCTLIRRRVLEAVDFTLRGSRAADFYFAVDVRKKGFSQKVDTTILCGHVISTEPMRVVYPDVVTRYRVEELVTA